MHVVRGDLGKHPLEDHAVLVIRRGMGLSADRTLARGPEGAHRI
jgi:hypothetical protein